MHVKLTDLFGTDRADILDYLFDRLPVGTAVIDRDFRLRRCNPTWADFIEQYTPSVAADVVPGASLFDLEPGTEAVLKPLFAPVFAGETVRQNAVRLESGGIISYWDVVLVPLEHDGEIVAALDVSLDATERVITQAALERTVTALRAGETRLKRANATLEQQVAERTAEIEQRYSELHALYRADEELYRHLDVNAVLQALVDVAVDVLGADKSSLMVWDAAQERLVVRAAHGFAPQTVAQMTFKAGEGTVGQVLQSGQPAVVEDARRDARTLSHITDMEGIRSFMHVPIEVAGHIFGVFNVDYTDTRSFSAAEERLMLALAQRAGVAIQNAQAFREEQRRRQAAESLRTILTLLNSGCPLDDLLQAIAAQAADLLGPQTAVALFQRSADRQRFELLASHQLPPALNRLKSVPVAAIGGDAFQRRRPLVVPDLVAYAQKTAPLVGGAEPATVAALELLPKLYASYLAVPLVVRDTLYGGLAFHFPTAQTFDVETVALAQTFSEQAALAIDNDRLRRQAEAAAVSTERNRLARELHDAVTQTLFSASLIAEVLPRIWERDAETGAAKLAELRELTRGALAEMRTLLLELRPATLTESSLEELLRQLAAAVTGRSRLQVLVTVDGNRPLPPEVQVALYRMAQEALNNVVKHAAATQVEVRLLFRPNTVTLTIQDDGRGFDPAVARPHSLGLGIMRERAAKIGADLQIKSVVDAGTTISVTVSDTMEEPTDDE